MPHGVDYTSSVTYGDTFPSKGKARVQRIILPQIRTITAYSDPSVIADAMTAPLTQGSQGMRCKNLYRAYGKRNAMVFTIVPIPGYCKKRIRSCLNAPLKKRKKLAVWRACFG